MKFGKHLQSAVVGKTEDGGKKKQYVSYAALKRIIKDMVGALRDADAGGAVRQRNRWRHKMQRDLELIRLNVSTRAKLLEGLFGELQASCVGLGICYTAEQIKRMAVLDEDFAAMFDFSGGTEPVLQGHSSSWGGGARAGSCGGAWSTTSTTAGDMDDPLVAKNSVFPVCDML